MSRLTWFGLGVLAGCGGSTDASGKLVPSEVTSTAAPSAVSSAPIASADPSKNGVAPYPGSRLRLVLPEGAVKIPYTAGYLTNGEELAIMTMDWQLPKKGDLTRRLAETWLKNVKGPRREIERSGVKGIEAMDDDGAVVAFYDEDGGVACVMLRYRKPQAKALGRSILDSVSFDPKATLDPLAQADMTFAELGDWYVVPQAGPGATMGEKVDGLPKNVFWPATLSTQFVTSFPPAGEDLMWFYAAVLKSKSAKDIRTKKVTINGLEGLEFEAAGADRGHDLALYGVVLRAEQGCFVITGTVDLARGKMVLPVMKKIVHSFKRIESRGK